MENLTNSNPIKENTISTIFKRQPVPMKKLRLKQSRLNHELLQSAYFGNLSGVRRWLKAGAQWDMADSDGWNPLHFAARWGDRVMCLVLLSYGAMIDVRTKGKETALHKAARWDRKDIAILLLKQGANIHFKNGDGKTAAEMTTSGELKYIIENFSQWQKEQKERNQIEEKKQQQSVNQEMMSFRKIGRRSPGRLFYVPQE